MFVVELSEAVEVAEAATEPVAARPLSEAEQQ